MPIYDDPVHTIMKNDMVDALGLRDGRSVTRQEVMAWFAQHYPKLAAGTVTAHLTRLSTNAPSRHHYGADPDDDLLYQIDTKNFRLYDPTTDPSPIYKPEDSDAKSIEAILPPPERGPQSSAADQVVADMLARFDRDEQATWFAEREAERRQIIAEFPLEEWPNLALERYALGQDDSRGTWCWWLEFGAPLLGSIRGGTARKFQVYKHKSDSGWYYRQSKYSDVKEAWRDLRATFVQLFKLVEAHRYDEAANLEPLASSQMLRLKSAYIYYPDRLLPINSHAHLIHYLKLLGGWQDSWISQDAMLLNRRLLERLRQVEALKGWTTMEMGSMLWTTNEPTIWTGRPSDAPAGKKSPEVAAATLQSAYLFAWNPNRWRWTDPPLETLIEQCWKGEQPGDTWSCGRTKTIKVGDRAFFIRLGKEPRGVFAAGTITRAPYPRVHWDDALAAEGKTEFGIEFEYDYLIDPEQHPDYLIDYTLLTGDPLLAEQHWSIQISGVTVEPEVAAALEDEIKQRKELGLPISSSYTPTDFLRHTHLTPTFADDLLALHADKPQLIFFGPPGTGKTFVARHFARLLTGYANPPADQIEIIQFHPSYGYEEFIEGIRPRVVGSAVTYDVEDGLFKRLCARARANPGRRYILIIDEINRGNLPRIFGELLLLLEYRNLAVTLPTSGDRFSIPENVTLLGTMNTADRSIALVDFALRRRFHFVQMAADPALYGRWHAAQDDLPPWLPALYKLLCDAITDDNFRIGHSALMGDRLTVADIERRWHYSVMPHLREYYFDQTDTAELYRWSGERVQRIVNGGG